MPKGIGYHTNDVKRNRRRRELKSKVSGSSEKSPIAQAIKKMR